MTRKTNIWKYMAVAVTALLFTTSCNQSYPGLYYEPDEDVPSNDEDLKIEETPIKIYTRSPAFFSLTTRNTRGTGAFDDANNQKKYDNAIFHVFAFRAGTGNDGMGGQGTLERAVDLSMSAYSERKNDSYNESCLLDGENYLTGMPYRFATNNNESEADANRTQYGSLEPTVDYPIYYSGTYQDVGYNFFAYYIDDWQPTSSNTHRTSDGISYDIDLDGNRDLLLGHANQLTVADFEKDGNYYDLHLSTEDRDRILGMAGGYSTFAGHRNVHPVIRMNHAMTRLVFQAYPGNESANRVKITGISVKSCSRATMKVAGRRFDDCGITFPDKASNKSLWKDMKLCDVVFNEDGTPSSTVNPDGFNSPYVLTYDNTISTQPLTTLGTSLLLVPEKNYEVTLHYDFIQENGEVKSFSAIYYINAPKDDGISVDENGENRFMPGVMYNIKIGVFGLEKIVMDAAVQGWSNGGSIEIDPDNPGTNPDLPGTGPDITIED